MHQPIRHDSDRRRSPSSTVVQSGATPAGPWKSWM